MAPCLTRVLALHSGGSSVRRGLRCRTTEGFPTAFSSSARSLHLSVTRRAARSEKHGKPLAPRWAEATISATYLRKSFFADHRRLYEGRPIYLPVSSGKRSYVAYLCIQGLRADALLVLLADHLLPEKRKVEGELADLREARQSGVRRGATERRFTEVQKLLEELTDFIARVTDLAEKGPPPPDDKTTKREVDARYVMDLDDGVMVNSAALWPLLEPQWKDPKKWWKELANAHGQEGLRLVPSRGALLPDARAGEVPRGPVARRRARVLLGAASGEGVRLGAAPPGRDPTGLHHRRAGVGRGSREVPQEHEREAQDILAKELKRRERKDAQGTTEARQGRSLTRRPRGRGVR